jgi:hypothetical protein
MAKVILTDETMVALTEDLVAGMTLAQACRERSLPYQTTRLAMIRAGMPVGRELIPVSGKTVRAAELWNSGSTLAEVGALLGISKQGAGSALRTAQKHWLLTRPMGHQPRKK